MHLAWLSQLLLGLSLNVNSLKRKRPSLITLFRSPYFFHSKQHRFTVLTVLYVRNFDMGLTKLRCHQGCLWKQETRGGFVTFQLVETVQYLLTAASSSDLATVSQVHTDLTPLSDLPSVSTFKDPYNYIEPTQIFKNSFKVS